jgi:hypothetical protein
MKKLVIKDYLERARKIGVKPNFYLSEPYLELVGAECDELGTGLCIIDCGMILFPFIINDKLSLDNSFNFNQSDFWVWSDLGIVISEDIYQRKFLDYEYIFNPMYFDHMEGGEWKVFRKNVRKWPRENPNWKYVTYDKLHRFQHFHHIHELIIEWLKGKKDDCQDAEFLANFAHFSSLSGINRKYLISNGKLVGINAWDENWEYINYRICMVDKSQPFLDEFMRYCFYTDPDIRRRKKWVNDGGVLDNPDLEKFKDKLNPLIKKKIYSIKKRS